MVRENEYPLKLNFHRKKIFEALLISVLNDIWEDIAFINVVD